ncbi:MAG: hypothetical protein ABEN55_02380 [Bradymonadaceae bacterium]
MFTPLSRRAMAELVDIEIDRMLERRGFARNDLTVETTESAKDWLEEHGFSERFGARELKRTLEGSVLTPISRLLVSSNGPHDGKTVVISADDGDIDVAFDDSGDASPAPPEADGVGEEHSTPRSPLEGAS